MLETEAKGVSMRFSGAFPESVNAPAHDISWWRTSFGADEAEAIAAAIRAEHISQGPVTAEFERRLAEILGVPYVVTTTSGSTALFMALKACDIGPGDEVILPSRSNIATPHAVLLAGATPVLVDCKPDLPIIDTDAIESLITSRTRAIIPVHLNGRAADMRVIHAIASKHGLRIVEDAAQALCSRNDSGPLGTQSCIGCFSLSVAKIISTGQGGYLATRDETLAKRLVGMRTHGVTDFINVTYSEVGFNFRLTDIQSSIGLVQLDRLSRRIEHVKEVYRMYEQGLSDLPFITMVPVNVEAGEIPIYIEVLCQNRQRLMDYLRARGIQARPFQPDLNTAAHLHTSRAFPNSRRFGEEGLCLPSGGEQPLENVCRVIQTLHDFAKSA